MRFTTRTAVALALGWVAVGAADASAAWNNVFQTTCNCGSSRPSYYVAPAPQACPQPCPQACPSVSYVQRCYYQPVTTYKTESYLEPVTSYKTSYYWDPVTSYRYTSYYDPCTGCCNRVATPQTSYYLRQQCNAVQSYVQRCRMVPVTEMRKSFYLEPVVTYHDPCGNAIAAPGAGVAPAAGISEPRSGAAAINESSEPPKIKSPGIPESIPRKVMPESDKPVRADRVASLSNFGRLQGHVVREDRITPRANATLKFIGEKDEEVLAKADRSGQFEVELPAGEWTLYVPGVDGKPTFHSTLVVNRSDDRRVTVVSR